MFLNDLGSVCCNFHIKGLLALGVGHLSIIVWVIPRCTIVVAISLPDPIFEATERLAQDLKIPPNDWPVPVGVSHYRRDITQIFSMSASLSISRNIPGSTQVISITNS